MNFNEIINSVNSKDDFLKFMEQLKHDKQNNCGEWENTDIESYIEGIASWVEDMEGYYNNMNYEMPQNIDWKFIATLLYIGKIYE